MESLLWALDLCAVVYLCLWFLKTDKRQAKEAEQLKQAVAPKGAAQAPRKERGHA